MNHAKLHSDPLQVENKDASTALGILLLQYLPHPLSFLPHLEGGNIDGKIRYRVLRTRAVKEFFFYNCRVRVSIYLGVGGGGELGVGVGVEVEKKTTK